jgi:predicted acyltransferase
VATTLTSERRRSAPATVHEEKTSPPAPPPRLMSLDAYRGWIMLVMASGGLGFARVWSQMETSVLATGIFGVAGSPGGFWSALGNLFPTRADLLPASGLWSFLGFQFEHVDWEGCAFWDLIQPSFMFMVGVAAPFSFASRVAKGDSYGKMFFHAVWRAILLILLAVFLSSPMTLSRATPTPWGPTTNWIFTNVLAQIGLGYIFVFLLVGRGWRLQLGVIAAILAGYTLFFGLWPAPADFDYKAVDVADGWRHHYTGWFAHWNKNSNAGHVFDLWFLNLFPRAEPFKFNSGGYVTLNFVPSLATMLLGLMAGELLRTKRSPAKKFVLLAATGAVCLAIGWLMGLFVCPIVKRIWTPSWAVFSSGWTFAILAAFYGVIDVLGWKRWSWPLVVVGMNSIAMYCMSQLLKPWIGSSLRTHIGRGAFLGDFAPVVMSASILLVLWLFCLWLYRRKIFLRI